MFWGEAEGTSGLLVATGVGAVATTMSQRATVPVTPVTLCSEPLVPNPSKLRGEGVWGRRICPPHHVLPHILAF